MHLTKSSIARVCGLALGILLVGCSSSGGGTTTDQSAALVGSWTYSSGSIDPMCNLTISPFDLTGDTMTVTKVDNTHVQTMLTGNGVMCDVTFSVSNGVAAAEPNQTCAVTEMVTGFGNVAVTIDITAWTLTVSGDTLTMSMNGTASAVGGALTCTPMASGTATRVSSGG
ncbi:MAG TPA: hypothetical protein VKZ18_07090 [Polyangia bacterium]|nr:hypothetical protein [Polyangia bacterium]